MRAALLGLALALVAAAPAAAAPQLVKIGDFDRPLYVTSPPRDSHLFVVEKGGIIKVVGGGTFLNLSSVVDGAAEERGLLSMAFSPGYASNGLFYVFYTEKGSGALKVVEYQRSAANPLQANATPRRTFLSLPHGDQYHNGGQLQIGPDGMLYVSTGDNHGRNPSPARDTDSPLGKILRLDPATGGPAAGNPFGNAVWSYGLRNPWRFSFDRGTGDIAIADVGDATWEEINWGTAPARARGVDFGWDESEGPGTVGTDPIVAESHNDGFCAIVGGYVVRDPGLPSLRGRYVFGDNCKTSLYTTTPRTGAGDEDPVPGITIPAITSFGEDACGRIYVASLGGSVSRLQDGAASPCSFNGQAADTTPPSIAVGITGVRKLLKKRVLRVSVRCNEACSATVGTRLREVRRLKPRHRSLAVQQRKVVRIKLGKALVKKVRKRVRRRGFVRIAVTVRATDAAGNVATKTRRARLKRR